MIRESSMGMRIEAFSRGSRNMWTHAVTLFLFTKSDFKTVVLPQTCFGLSMALSNAGASPTLPVLGRVVRRLPHTLAWIWLHLLVGNISNQRLAKSVLEDSVNKAWRPIPAGRITKGEAQSLLRVAIPAALLLSIFLASSGPSTMLMAALWLYNDLDGSSVGPWQRNALNAVVLACFGWGSASVLLAGYCEDEEFLRNWILLTAAVVMMTIHAQDLPDMAGDKARGRRTIPLVYGDIWARWSIAVLVPTWSMICLKFWQVHALGWMILLFIAGAMALLVILRRDHSSDKQVWRLWCLWMSALYFLPIFGQTR